MKFPNPWEKDGLRQKCSADWHFLGPVSVEITMAATQEDVAYFSDRKVKILNVFPLLFTMISIHKID